MTNTGKKVQYDRQNFFELASIQSAAPGLFVIMSGKHLVSQYGAGTVICSVALGNLILWLVGIGVISMVDQIRSNAIENIKNYFGKYAKFLAAVIFLIAMLNGYAFEINFCVDFLSKLLGFSEEIKRMFTLRMGAGLGLLSAILSIGGIRLFKKIAVFSLPILLAHHVYIIVTSDLSVPLEGTWSFSLPIIVYAILLLLPGVINFPTFFRHSCSRNHSILALTLITLLITFLELSSIWWTSGPPINLLHTILLLLIIIIYPTCCNLLNIYLAAACWETVSARLGEPKWFAILGLFGTLAYTFIQVSFPARVMQDLTNSYIAILGVILLLAYLTRLIIKHRPKSFEKSINLAAWLFGCVISTVYEVQHFLQGNHALLAGVTGSVLFFLVVIFIEETVWATRVKWSRSSLKVD